MRWCNVQTNLYDLQAKTYPTICTHHKLHNNTENKIPVFPEWQDMMQQTSQAHNRFDDDNSMGYRYILSIISTEKGQMNRYNPVYCNDNKR